MRSAYFPRLKSIYIPAPKVAGSTILASFIAADDSPHLAGIVDHNSDESRQLLSAEHDLRAFWRALHDPTCFRFAFVRNPYTRVVSSFLDKIASGREPRFRKALAFAPEYKVTLLEFLRRISEQEIDSMNRHWRPQSALISSKVNIDFLGRFERFDEDFTTVRRHLGVDDKYVQNRFEHRTSAANSTDLIGPEEKVLIDRIYHDDFERFAYIKTRL